MRPFFRLAAFLLCPALFVLASPARPRPEPAARRDGVQDDSRLDLCEVGVWPYGPSQAVACDPQRRLLFSSAARVVQCYRLSDSSQPVKIGPEICANSKDTYENLCVPSRLL